jgi:hypothetical protein
MSMRSWIRNVFARPPHPLVARPRTWPHVPPGELPVGVEGVNRLRLEHFLSGFPLYFRLER